MLNFLRGRPAQATRMSPQQAVALSKDDQVTLVDVRDHTELAASGKAAGALHIPLAVLQMQANPASPDFNRALGAGKPIAVYCASGGRSSMAARVLAQHGFDDVHNIGGLAHWQMAGGAVERV